MKELILLFIITILIKGYVNECSVDGTTCRGSETGIFNCVYNEGKCIKKYYCDKVEVKNEENCGNAITSNIDSEKCVYDSGNCVIKKICDSLPTLDSTECANAITLNPETTECIFDSEEQSENKCKVKEKCELKDFPTSESDCSSIKVTDEENSKCVLDETEGTQTCKVKKICKPSLEESDCNSAVTSSPTTKCQYNEDLAYNNCEEKELCVIETDPSSDKCIKIPVSNPKLKCIFVEGSDTCLTENRDCSEIGNGASASICESVEILNGNGCTYDETNNKCKEFTRCINVGTITDETICASTPTSNDVTKKCVVKTVGDIKSCDEESKTCSEITKEATEQICKNAPVSDDTTKKCKLNSSKPGECIEIDKGSEQDEQTEKLDPDLGGSDSKTDKEESGNNTGKIDNVDSTDKKDNDKTDSTDKKDDKTDSTDKNDDKNDSTDKNDDKTDSVDKKDDDNNRKIMKLSLALMGFLLL